MVFEIGVGLCLGLAYKRHWVEGREGRLKGHIVVLCTSEEDGLRAVTDLQIDESS